MVGEAMEPRSPFVVQEKGEGALRAHGQGKMDRRPIDFLLRETGR
jgi:hypothetical protein